MAKPLNARHLKPRRTLLENAAQAIGARLDEMLAYDRYVEQPNAITQLHEMRIAAKRLRYTLEIFEDAFVRYTPFADAYTEIISSVKAIQETLGILHDADVLVPELTAHLAGLTKQGTPLEPGVHHVDFDACLGLLALCRETREARDRRYRKFVAEWQEMKHAGKFMAWRELLAHAVQVEATEAGMKTPGYTPHAAPIEETGYGRDSHNGATDQYSAPPEQRSGPTKSARRRRSAPNTGGDTGTGPDTGEGAD